MLEIFGPHTQRVLTFVAELSELSQAEIATVTRVWRGTDDRDRAEAWVRIHQAVTEGERQPVLAAAAVARQEALDVARRYPRADWPFWAAAADAAAGIAAGDRIGDHYVTLVSPLAAVMSWLSRPDGEVRIGGHGRDADRAAGVLGQGA